MIQLLRRFGIRARLWLLIVLACLSLLSVSVSAIYHSRSVMLEEKQQKIQEQVASAYSLLNHYHQRAQNGELSAAQAQHQALAALRSMRYADNAYFWSSDLQGRVVMHPDLAVQGTQLMDRQDANGRYFIRDMLRLAQQQGEGLIHYHWNKPGTKRPVPKITYFRVFEPWQLLISTGIYVDDVDAAFWRSLASYSVLLALLGAMLAGGSMLLASSIVRPIRRTVEMMHEIADGDGDLRHRLPEQGHDELTQLAQGFNRFVEKIQHLVKQVDNSTTQVASASEELASVTEQGSQTVQQQSQETDQVATAINEMTATVQEVAHSANEAAAAARQARETTHQGKQTLDTTSQTLSELAHNVEQAAQVIDALKADTENIGSILDVIGGVAEQTNLLALNAAIEAARAGEHGRGFAVVADEVRTLASRTQQSTHEIHDMIEQLRNKANQSYQVMHDSRTKAEETVQLAQKTNQALRTVEEAVAHITDMNHQIASAAEEQSAVAEEINRNVVNINELSSQTSEMAQQTTHASHELARLGDQLHALVKQFRT